MPSRVDDRVHQRQTSGRRRVVVGGGLAALVVALVVIAGERRPDVQVRTTRSESLPPAGGEAPSPISDPVSVPPSSASPSSVPTSGVPTSGVPPVSVPTSTGSTVVDPDVALADPNLWVLLHPELADAPAPAWVAAGTRITYYAIAASVPGSYHQYVEDEDGGWVDPTTGDRYRQEDIPAPAGHGYHQVTVTALDDHVAALSIRVFGLTGVERSSPVTTLTWGGAIGIPGAGADYWVDPAVLGSLDEVVTDELKVLRMPYTIGDDTYTSIWVQVIGDDGNITWVYDTVSGVLLHTASSTTGPPLTGPVATGEGREGSTFLTQSTFVGWRQTTLPWATSHAPDWLATVHRVDYTGSITIEVLGTPSVVLDASLAVERVQSGDDWARLAISRTISSDVAPSITETVVRVDGPAQVGALFVPPDALRALVAGQVLDTDPITGAVVSVDGIEVAADDTYVTIVERGPAEWSTTVYAASTGLLVSTSSTDATIGATSRFELVGWS